MNQIIGPEEMHPRVLRELTNVIVRPFSTIFEQSKQSGQICDNWKKVNIMLFVKKDKKEDLGNCKSHFSPWEGCGANLPESCIQACEGH